MTLPRPPRSARILGLGLSLALLPLASASAQGVVQLDRPEYVVVLKPGPQAAQRARAMGQARGASHS